MKHRLALFCAALLCLIGQTKAETTIGLHLFTAHSESGFHNQNPGIYVQHESGVTAGVFHNSYRRTSVYAGYSFRTDDKRFALTVGGITGYPAAKVMPLVVPSMRLNVDSICKGCAARVSYIPRPPKNGTASGVHFSIERSF